MASVAVVSIKNGNKKFSRTRRFLFFFSGRINRKQIVKLKTEVNSFSYWLLMLQQRDDA